MTFHSMMRRRRGAAWLAVAILALTPAHAHACACGCGVFEIGTPAMFPTGTGGMFSLEYDFMNQNANWSETSAAPAEDNEDQQIRTSFVTAGAQYLFNRTWGVTAELPYWDRLFRTTEGGENATFTHAALGDVRIQGLFTGVSPDLSTGLSAGLKLPTGDYKYENFDRDTQIGTGSTDLLLGGYHAGALTASRAWTWFVDGEWDQPFAYSGDYHPGSDVNATVAVSYTAYRPAGIGIAPMLGVLGSVRARDSGAEADPDNSGYNRVLLTPGLDVRAAGLRATLVVNVPVYQHVNGNQLVAPALVKVALGHGF